MSPLYQNTSKALTFDVQSHSVFGSLSILEEQSRPGGRSYREEFYAKNRNYGTRAGDISLMKIMLLALKRGLSGDASSPGTCSCTFLRVDRDTTAV